VTPLTASLGAGAIGAGIGLLCGCPERTVRYGALGLVAGAIVGKLLEKEKPPRVAGNFATGLTCPAGWDLVSTADSQIACAYRQKASCLGGFTTPEGHFQCSDWDFPACPPGTETRPGGPKNWCFPMSTTSGATHTTTGFEGRIDRTPHGALGEAFWTPEEMASPTFPDEFASFMRRVHERAEQTSSGCSGCGQ
jgi:hypothetical protein